jgi:phosphoserine aminotransferase
MICVEDYLDALQWAGEIGLQGLINRSMENLKVVEEWVARTDWIEFLAESEEIRSNTSVCLKVTSDPFKAMTKDSQSKFIKDIAGQLSRENIAHDIGSYRDAPPGFRLWCGPTIQPSDVKTVIEGLERVYSEKIKNV